MLRYQECLIQLVLQVRTALQGLSALRPVNASPIHAVHILVIWLLSVPLNKPLCKTNTIQILCPPTNNPVLLHWTARLLWMLLIVLPSTPIDIACQVSQEILPPVFTTPPQEQEQLLPQTIQVLLLFTSATKCLSSGRRRHRMLKWFKPLPLLSLLLPLCFILLDEALKEIWIFFLSFPYKLRLKYLSIYLSN